MDIVDPRIERYMTGRLARFDEPVLLEMEAEASERRFPIVERNVGVTLEILARSIGAQRMIELGSGFGYSGYWHSRAVGSSGELHLTDGDPANETKARDYLTRAGLWHPVTFHVGDAVESLNALDGVFDLVYDDIDKDGYPDAWRAARDRIRIGGLYICDNVLWSGRVPEDGEEPDGVTDAIREHNALIAEDERYVSTIVPTRDGVMVAIRIS
ncbi:MAG: caffeoyl-CoA O-methyltransferase [Actinomycetota bacterium]|jgi:predicted O-methyltransferase YrrM|nr:caffeoyl-CoA O-methyltransferase [Actinomycetota bacterium]